MTLVKEMIYREPEEKDRDAIKELLNLSFDPVYAKYAKMSFESLEQSLVVEDENRLIGVANWRTLQAYEEKIGYLFWLAIHPDFRRKGIGESLMQRAIEILIQQKLSVILTTVEKDNTPSRSLFEKLGFTGIKRTEMRKRYGKESPRLIREMWLMPWEDLFIKIIQNIEGNS